MSDFAGCTPLMFIDLADEDVPHYCKKEACLIKGGFLNYKPNSAFITLSMNPFASENAQRMISSARFASLTDENKDVDVADLTLHSQKLIEKVILDLFCYLAQ